MLQSTSEQRIGQSEIITIPMSLSEFLAWPDDHDKIEWVDGEAFLMPPPTNRHELLVMRLAAQIIGQIPLDRFFVSAGSGFRQPNRYRIPDLLIADSAEITLDDSWIDRLLVAVEVLSRSTFMMDKYTKSKEYAKAGTPQFWLVDPLEQTVLVQTNDGAGGWNEVAELSEANPKVAVEIPTFGEITLDWQRLFAALARG